MSSSPLWLLFWLPTEMLLLPAALQRTALGRQRDCRVDAEAQGHGKRAAGTRLSTGQDHANKKEQQRLRPVSGMKVDLPLALVSPAGRRGNSTSRRIAIGVQGERRVLWSSLFVR